MLVRFRPSEKHWVSLTDITSRYSLFSTEREGLMMPSILGNCKATTRYFMEVQGRTPTFVEITDSEAIASAFSNRRLKSTPLPNIIFATMLFDYASLNLHPSIFKTRIPEMFAGILERAWVQLEKAGQLSDREIGNLSTFIERLFQTVVYGPRYLRYQLTDHCLGAFCQEERHIQPLFLELWPKRYFWTILGVLPYYQHFHRTDFSLVSLALGIMENIGG